MTHEQFIVWHDALREESNPVIYFTKDGATIWNEARAVFVAAFAQADGDWEDRAQEGCNAVYFMDTPLAHDLSQYLSDDAEANPFQNQARVDAFLRLAAIEADCNRLDAAVRQVRAGDPASWAALGAVVRGLGGCDG